jgi:GMP synthase-like glutamine amidotransferase
MPVLGICLGGQMLAHLTGGVVKADAGAPEVGSTAITMRPEATDDALFGELPREVTAVENHVDVIEKLPPDAVWLATSTRCPHQAFRIGRTAWGLQFHPEASAANVEDWNDDGIATRGFDPDEVKQRTRDADPVAAPHWRGMARRFAAVVTG